MEGLGTSLLFSTHSNAVISIVVGLIGFLLFLFLIIMLWIRRKNARNDASQNTSQTVLLMGPCSAGKTLLYNRLLLLRSSSAHKNDDEEEEVEEKEKLPVIQTVTSMEESSAIVNNDNTSSSKATTSSLLVDIPGHPKLFPFSFTKYTSLSSSSSIPSSTSKKTTLIILFLVDASGNDEHFKRAGELSYNLLMDTTLFQRQRISGKKIKVKFLFNKMDLRTSLGLEEAQARLEQEIENNRTSREADLLSLKDTRKGGEGSREDEEGHYLGFEGEPFKFEHIMSSEEEEDKDYRNFMISFGGLSALKDSEFNGLF